jgi:ketosteroid isomerase-like protein
MQPLQIATAFSNGDFVPVFPYLSDAVAWQIVGEKTLCGKEAVVAHCTQTAAYFASFTTEFVTHQCVSGQNAVAINGRAQFIRDGQTVSIIDACDLYEFDAAGLLVRIWSYCIPASVEGN